MAMNPKYASQGGSRLQAVVSQDMGATWTLIADYAADAGWAYEYGSSRPATSHVVLLVLITRRAILLT